MLALLIFPNNKIRKKGGKNYKYKSKKQTHVFEDVPRIVKQPFVELGPYGLGIKIKFRPSLWVLYIRGFRYLISVIFTKKFYFLNAAIALCALAWSKRDYSVVTFIVLFYTYITYVWCCKLFLAIPVALTFPKVKAVTSVILAIISES